jgi:anaerobic selenocysteine-containing dehydrogenase
MLAHAETVIGFAPFLDDSAAWADWLLPDHHTLELEAALTPAASARISVAVGVPFVRPLYETRAVEQTLAGIAAKLNAAYQTVTAKDFVAPLLPADTPYDDVARQGGLWLEAPEAPKAQAHPWEGSLAPAAEFRGDPAHYPFQFLPYLSVQYYDGRASHLPWMQELPDPASSAMWGLPVEIDPRSAARLGISTGDRVRVESVYGAVEAPAFVHPGAAPGVLSMAIGDGHTHFGRYASGRGSNPLAILAPVREGSTGALVLGSTRVRLTRVGGRHGFIQFSAQYREEGIGHR